MVGPDKVEPSQNHKAAAGEHSDSSDIIRVTEGREGLCIHCRDAGTRCTCPKRSGGSRGWRWPSRRSVLSTPALHWCGGRRCWTCPVAGPRSPDVGEVGDDHGHDRPGPRLNMSFRDTRSRLQFRVCAEEGPGDCCAVYATNHMSIRHQMQLFTFRNAISLSLILVRGPVLRHVRPLLNTVDPFRSVTIGRAVAG